MFLSDALQVSLGTLGPHSGAIIYCWYCVLTVVDVSQIMIMSHHYCLPSDFVPSLMLKKLVIYKLLTPLIYILKLGLNSFLLMEVSKTFNLRSYLFRHTINLFTSAKFLCIDEHF